jgi:hypothetical protein
MKPPGKTVDGSTGEKVAVGEDWVVETPAWNDKM